MEHFKVAADRNALRQQPAVVELEHRNPAERILGEEGRLSIHTLHDIDFLERHLESLLGEEYPNPPRIWREFVAVNLHFDSPTSTPFLPCQCTSGGFVIFNPYRAPIRIAH